MLCFLFGRALVPNKDFSTDIFQHIHGFVEGRNICWMILSHAVLATSRLDTSEEFS